MATATIQAIYLGQVGVTAGLYDIDINGGSTQTDQANDPDWSSTAYGLDSDDTTAGGGGFFLGNTYTSFARHNITLQGSSAADARLNTYYPNAAAYDWIVDQGTSSVFEGTCQHFATLRFNTPSGVVTIDHVHVNFIQDELGRTYLVAMQGLPTGTWVPAGVKDLGSLVEQYGLSNLVSMTVNEAGPGGHDYRTSADHNGNYYDSRGGNTHISWGPPPSPNASYAYIESLPCYTTGTLIGTERGQVAIEDLSNEDRILDRNGNLHPILWIGKTTTNASGSNRAVIIPQGVFGLERDMIVSQQHCMVMSLNGTDYLVKAKFLAEMNWQECRFMKTGEEVTYFHLLLPQHTIINADGAWSESFYPGAQIMRTLKVATRTALAAVLPGVLACETNDEIAALYGPSALPHLSRAQFNQYFRRSRAAAKPVSAPNVCADARRI